MGAAVAAMGIVAATAEKAGNVLALMSNRTKINLLYIWSSGKGTPAYSLAGAGGLCRQCFSGSSKEMSLKWKQHQQWRRLRR